jgi:hypothetical protein
VKITSQLLGRVEFLYHNKGNGTFEEVGLLAGVAVDGDGRTFAAWASIFCIGTQ